MKIIESKQNPIFKKALKIIHDQNKFPDLIVVEGAKLIREALQAGLKPQTFFCSKKKDNSLKELENLGFEVTPALFRELTTVTSPDEGICIFSRPAFKALEKVLISAKLLVIIDRLQDPGNIGTILRTCEAMGADAAIILKGSC
ncbi:MAG: TrmH family RNA methyltransferase, partial [Candidatus Riflebacteria bacterium]